jgi:sugar phosphate isomerase/epimerase
MELACSSESYSKELDSGQLTLEAWLRLCADDLGLKAVELEDRHVGEPTAGRLAEVRALADRYDLEIVNIAFMNNFGLADNARRQAEQARTVTWMTAAQRLRTRFLRTFAGWPEGDRSARWPAMITALRATAQEAERRGVRLVLENHNHGGFVQTSSDVQAILTEVGNRALGLLLDTGNYLDGLGSIKQTVQFAWHVHAKYTAVLPDGRDTRIDHDAVLPLLQAAGYRGCISVEYEGAEPGTTAVPRALAYLRTALSSG